jgi:hypothetical protein
MWTEFRENIVIQEDRPAFLSKFFRTCDDLRFSGTIVTSDTLIQLLNDMKDFLDILESDKNPQDSLNVTENKQKEEAL